MPFLLVEILNYQCSAHLIGVGSLRSVSIKPIMDKKGINRNELCRSIDSRYEVVNKWYNGTIEKIDTDVLARICYVLECKPEDIIHYNYPKSE